jgi:acetoin utilization deacetylase AcuC-like enzyme
MTTALVTHADCLLHDTGPDHPECADRLRVVLAALEGEAFHYLDRHEAPLANREQLARVHDAGYIEAVLAAIPKQGHSRLDPDTVVSPGSGTAALRAAGAGCLAVDLVLTGRAYNAFCAVRPPGHHAERAEAMGFCLFNTVAVAAEHARAAHGLQRVAVVDFDVHHGNGTQSMFWNEAGLLYASTHEADAYPFSGLAQEHGAFGTIINAPLPRNADGAAFADAFESIILPALDAFAPQLVIVSAGFDAHLRDPLAHLRLTAADFVWATQQLMQVAARHCQGRLVSCLEGGYDLPALAQCAAAHVRALMHG